MGVGKQRLVEFPVYKRTNNGVTYYVFYLYQSDRWHIDVDEWYLKTETYITSNASAPCPPESGWGVFVEYNNTESFIREIIRVKNKP